MARALLRDVIASDPRHAASFGFAGPNRRGLRDDVGTVVHSALSPHPMPAALTPPAELREDWPVLPPPRPLPADPGVAVPPRRAWPATLTRRQR